MSDLISRQMALDAFGLSEKTRKCGGDHSGYDTRMLYEIQDTLENLPAVQPDHNADSSKMVCVDAISRQETIHAISDWIYDTTDERLPETVIHDLSAVQPERKHGKWERHYSRPNVYADLCWHCSACGYKTAESWANHFKFCPECGADMRKGEPNANN